MTEVNFKKLETKWQKKWEQERIFQVLDNQKKEKFYILEMFPYPSGSGLHMGHVFNYTIGDIYARYKRMQGFNVLYPMGYDSFGLPAENAAISAGVHPKEYTEKSISNFINQQKMLGLSYDWSRMIKTSDPEYYRWDQWIFLQMLKKKIAYKKKAPVNWCPKCKTVLANEQVQEGKCWRHEDTQVEIKDLEQWFFKITNYAEELLDDIDKLNWPKRTKIMQKNWIGRSEGVEIDFEINDSKFSVFTTRSDTIFGVTFLVISPQHPQLENFIKSSEKQKVENFLKELKNVSEKDLVKIKKEGIFTGSYAKNPINDEKIPVYIGNFVVSDYASGMIMGVPAHDQRDFEFAIEYNLPIKVVIKPNEYEIETEREKITEAYLGDGILINSENFNDLDNKKAKQEITKFLEKKNFAKKKVNYKLRDWLISRQRYWGTPIPIIYCVDCGTIPVSEKELPVKLPEKVVFGEGNPLTTNNEWINVKCPVCRKPAKRETDTMDTFVNSSWYFLKYCDPDNNNEIFNKEKVKYWMPIDQYIGGAEHACLHLLFFRFYTKFLRDLGLLNFDEPTKKLFHQGMLHGEDGEKMSKSKGNTISPEKVSEMYGIDTARMFLVSVASTDSDISWSEKGINGTLKFIKKLFEYFEDVKISKDTDMKIESKLNKTIKDVTFDIENFKYNLAVIKLRELFNLLPKETSKEVLEKSLKLLSPFCPHLAEEFWKKIGNKDFISLSEWPIFEERKINNFFEKQEQASEKLVSDITHLLKIFEQRGQKNKMVYIYVLPGEKDFYDIDELKKKVNKEIKIFEVNDSKKYDPNQTSKKAKPGKPGVYLE